MTKAQRSRQINSAASLKQTSAHSSMLVPLLLACAISKTYSKVTAIRLDMNKTEISYASNKYNW